MPTSITERLSRTLARAKGKRAELARESQLLATIEQLESDLQQATAERIRIDGLKASAGDFALKEKLR